MNKIFANGLLIFFVCFVGIMIFFNTHVYAESNDFWGQANDWFGKGTITDLKSGDSSIANIINEFEKMINIIGTTVIVCVTTFLGIKYMFGSVDSKADVKNSLLTLLVACIFFFGWNAIWNLLFPGGKFVLNEGGYENVVANIFSLVSLVANILAVAAVIYMGIKYIFAGATGKAELKGKSWIFLLGVILAFCSVGVLNYISKVVGEILG